MKIGVMCAIFQLSGKIPISKRLLNNLLKGYDISFEISSRNFPEIHQERTCRGAFSNPLTACAVENYAELVQKHFSRYHTEKA